MNNKDTKLLRGQVRQVVKEILNEVLTQELVAAVRKAVEADNAAYRTLANAKIQDTLLQLDNRSKDIQSYVMRSLRTTPPKDTP